MRVPYWKNKKRSRAGKLSLFFKWLRADDKSVFEITVEVARLGENRAVDPLPELLSRCIKMLPTEFAETHIHVPNGACRIARAQPECFLHVRKRFLAMY
jgi:hypothetical protein